MDRERVLRMSQAEARELKALVEAELERRFEAIKEKLEHYWTVVVGYDAGEAWSELRALVEALVKSNLASLDKSLEIVLAVPPVHAPVVEAPKELELEPELEEPAVVPVVEPEEPAVVPVVESVKPELEPGARRSRS
ncbi:hypothetical protein ES703_83796 [subsurface metagenome]